MTSLDHLLHFRQAADGQIPLDCIARYLCTKASWRGKYRRVLCITSTCITTQHPDSLTITNQWDFAADTDIDGVSAPSSTAEEQEFVLSVRQDKKVWCCTCMVFAASQSGEFTWCPVCRASSSPSNSRASNAAPFCPCCFRQWPLQPCMANVLLPPKYLGKSETLL